MKFCSFLITLLVGITLQSPAQTLPEVEAKLTRMAYDILTHDSLNYKIKRNREFAQLLIETLKRPESFTYPFDSLKSISILSPADKSFRLFTWHIVDKNFNEFYGKQQHYYFGLVQRKYESAGSPTEYVVIPLVELTEIPRDIENRILDNNNWLGGLYYKPRDKDFIPAETFKYLETVQPGRKGKKIKQKFYVLTGWNGADNRSNFKFVDVMAFDPNRKDRVIFGATVFYFDLIPKARAIFRYSEIAPFTLNYSHVKWGPGKIFRKRMLVFDHLAAPNNREKRMQVMWEMGPDGSYDGLNFYQGGGYFEWHRNVRLATKFNNKYSRKQLEEARERERKRLQSAGIPYPNSNR